MKSLLILGAGGFGQMGEGNSVSSWGMRRSYFLTMRRLEGRSRKVLRLYGQ